MESYRSIVLRPPCSLVFFMLLMSPLAFSESNAVVASYKDICARMENDKLSRASKPERRVQEMTDEIISDVVVVKDNRGVAAAESLGSSYAILVGADNNSSLVSSEPRDVYEAAVSGPCQGR